MVPDQSKTCLGMEYFCNEGDKLWQMSDAELVQLASGEVKALGLVDLEVAIEDGTVIRQYKAYPVYDDEYRHNVAVIQEYIQKFENLQTVGRNRMQTSKRCNSSRQTQIILADDRDPLLPEGVYRPLAIKGLWNVNVERSYHEEFTDSKEAYSNLKSEVVTISN